MIDAEMKNKMRVQGSQFLRGLLHGVGRRSPGDRRRHEVRSVVRE